MKSKTYAFGKIVKRYSIPLDEIEDLNTIYDKERKKLKNFGHRLAGRLESELAFTHLLQSTKAFKTLTKCMNDYTMALNHLALNNAISSNLNILSCWINDMKEGEYNPPHTHHNLTGMSTVLFLKVPEYINEEKHPHKFKDGQLGFISTDGVACTWMDDIKVGDFFIFLASHQHCVMPFKPKIKGEIRRSMSFNFVSVS